MTAPSVLREVLPPGAKVYDLLDPTIVQGYPQVIPPERGRGAVLEEQLDNPSHLPSF